jgi:hypothetical protein
VPKADSAEIHGFLMERPAAQQSRAQIMSKTHPSVQNMCKTQSDDKLFFIKLAFSVILSRLFSHRDAARVGQ